MIVREHPQPTLRIEDLVCASPWRAANAVNAEVLDGRLCYFYALLVEGRQARLHSLNSGPATNCVRDLRALGHGWLIDFAIDEIVVGDGSAPQSGASRRVVLSEKEPELWHEQLVEQAARQLFCDFVSAEVGEAALAEPTTADVGKTFVLSARYELHRRAAQRRVAIATSKQRLREYEDELRSQRSTMQEHVRRGVSWPVSLEVACVQFGGWSRYLFAYRSKLDYVRSFPLSPEQRAAGNAALQACLDAAVFSSMD